VSELWHSGKFETKDAKQQQQKSRKWDRDEDEKE
jgi:hypothetical protein